MFAAVLRLVDDAAAADGPALATSGTVEAPRCDTANLHTKILDFGGFASSRILIARGGIHMSIGDFPETFVDVKGN